MFPYILTYILGSITNIHVSPPSTPNSGLVITKVKPNPPEKPTLAKKPNQHCSPEGNMVSDNSSLEHNNLTDITILIGFCIPRTNLNYFTHFHVKQY